MRAPYNTTCTLLDGPTTATPGFPRLADAPCRLVSDALFRATTAPLSDAFAYFTIDAGEPLGATWSEGVAQVWTADYGKADRCEFADFPGIVWYVVRVDLCTVPDQAPYWRAEIAQVDVPPPVVCSDAYAESYSITRVGWEAPIIVFRIGTALWSDSGANLIAETTTPDPETCLSLWQFLYDGFIWEGVYNGVGLVSMSRTDDPMDVVTLDPLP